jgi:hypothetical protein
MNVGKTVFAQIMSHMRWYEFDKLVAKYNGDYRVKNFTTRQQFLVMCFAQLTRRESLRDIESCMNAIPEKLYHAGFRQLIKRSTLADANETRDYRIFEEYAQVLIKIARELYQTDNDFKVDLDNVVYALDSTTIDLCLNLFPWAKFRKNKGAVKAHVLLDLRGSIPTFIDVTDGLCHDVNILDAIVPEAGAFYVMDKGYVDFFRLFQLNKCAAYYVTRAKRNMQFQRLTASPVDKAIGLICDQQIRLTGQNPSKYYPDTLRRIRYNDLELNKSFVFLTNNFEIPALTVTQLYKERWKIESFFRWIKQHLRIKAFFGTSENAVNTQIWIATCAYLLLAIAKKKLMINQTLYTLSQVVEFCVFEKITINELFSDKSKYNFEPEKDNQLKLFNL